MSSIDSFAGQHGESKVRLAVADRGALQSCASPASCEYTYLTPTTSCWKVVAHEINNPLFVIRSVLELNQAAIPASVLSKLEVGATKSSHHIFILRNCNLSSFSFPVQFPLSKISNILETVLDSVRLEQDQLQGEFLPRNEPTYVHELVQRSCAMMGHLTRRCAC